MRLRCFISGIHERLDMDPWLHIAVFSIFYSSVSHEFKCLLTFLTNICLNKKHGLLLNVLLLPLSSFSFLPPILSICFFCRLSVSLFGSLSASKKHELLSTIYLSGADYGQYVIVQLIWIVCERLRFVELLRGLEPEADDGEEENRFDTSLLSELYQLQEQIFRIVFIIYLEVLSINKLKYIKIPSVEFPNNIKDNVTPH